ncbi:MAG: anthranilate synthase component I [Bacteroidetes bacterium GWF2_33_16]|nr:MAG: anthranilate synthase component I [Bacteroidetes bacterium GWE2_32_14]OFY04580.1 MAG: anthranilate synthase component I [Bacteroidetes bacterium GWF2_33_16]
MRKITVNSTKMLADTYTPVSIYLKVRDVFMKSILLESTDFHHLENCYSFICMDPIAEIEVKNDILFTQFGGERKDQPIKERGKVLSEMEKFFKSFSLTGKEFSFNGFFGYSSYNSVQHFETIKLKNRADESSIPDLHYALYRFIIAFNHLKDEIILIENLPEGQLSGLSEVENLIQNGKTSFFPFDAVGNETSNLSDKEYINMVKNAKLHCLRGDVFQLVVSRRFNQKFIGDEFNVYRHLRSLNPSPYLFYFDYGNFKLFGSSPESQIEIKNNKAYINPIAGTYARSGNDEKDKELALLLSEDPKENAEHVMLVDLARNDLSRNSGNVKVENFKDIHFYSHVIHIVSKVSGELPVYYSPVKILADSFPAGTLTGAPKYKAMQLIDIYEPTERGFYGGCIGFIGFNSSVNQAITIRTFLSKNNTLYYQAGAGIVSKSEETKEMHEVNHKLGALKEAIQKAISTHSRKLSGSLITNSQSS